jgi:hypothetical protein
VTWARNVFVSLFIGGLLLAACQRKAPGPLECQEFSLRAVGVTERRSLERPDVKDAVDELTVRCLTTPFDRSLLRCVEERGQLNRCFIEFRARRQELPLRPVEVEPAPF